MGNEKIRFLVFLSLILVNFTPQAQATLGGLANSIEADRQSLSAIRHDDVVRTNYTVEEIQSGSVKVREYVSSTGVIFGVAWNGLTHPDLQTLLGLHYYGLYQNTLSQMKLVRGRKNLVVKNENLVVRKGGHQRSLLGQAYDPSLVPKGVTTDEIK